MVRPSARRSRLILHLGVGDRRTPRQGVRSDFGRGAGRDPCRGSDGPRRLRNGRDHRTWSWCSARSRPHLRRHSTASSANVMQRHWLHRFRRIGIRRPRPAASWSRSRSRARRSRGVGTCAREPRRRAEDPFDLTGAGDQGMMIGLRLQRDAGADAAADRAGAPPHPAPVRGAQIRRVPWLLPDGKSQVTVEYHDGKPVRVDTIVISTQHLDTVSNDEIDADGARAGHRRRSCRPRCSTRTRKIYVNPSGRFAIGGPMADAGLTGRKIIVDTYGGMARHGGGAFSGKDATKVDRSAAYAARYVAKNVVAAGLADASRSRSPTPSAWRTRSRSWSRPSAPASSPTRQIEQADRGRRSICGRPRSSTTSICAARSTGRPPPTAISVATDLDLPWEQTDKVEALQAAAGIESFASARRSRPHRSTC